MDATPMMDLLFEHQRLTSVDEYHRLIDAEIFRDREHVELLHGRLISGLPASGPEARIIQRLNGILVRGLGPNYDVRVQLPLTLRDDSEPEPDFSIVPHGDEGKALDHPISALLVIEVSRTTLRFDRLVKGPLYARAGIPEYWLIDVNGRQVEVLRDPDPKTLGYRTHAILGPDETLTPVAFPTFTLHTRDLFA